MGMITQGVKPAVLAGVSAGLSACADRGQRGPFGLRSPVDPRRAGIGLPAVLRSTLVSNAEPTYLQAQLRDGAEWTAVLARRERGGLPEPVAVTRSAGKGASRVVSVQRLSGASNSESNVLVLEHL